MGELNSMEERISRLETEHHKLQKSIAVYQKLLAIAVLFGLSFILMGQTSAQKTSDKIPDLILAKAFVLVGDNGKKMAQIGFNDNGGTFTINDKTGKLRGMFGVSEDNIAVLGLSDINGKPLVKINASDDLAAVNLLDAKGTNRIFLESRPDTSSLNIMDSNGKVRILFNADSNDSTLGLYDTNSSCRAMMAAKVRDSALGLLDSTGNPRILFEASNIDQKMMIRDASKLLWSAP